MPTPPVFWRSPRLNPPLPQEDIEIPAPPSKPSPPSPVLPMIMSAGLIAIVMLSIGLATGRMSLMMFSVPMILASGLAAIGANQFQKREYKKQLQERDTGYTGLLLSYEKQLQELAEQQYKLLLKKDPDPKICLEWAEKLHRNIWVRKPDNADFLEIRLGLGERPSTVSIVPPRTDNPISPDPLIVHAQDLVQQFEFVKNSPISLPLREAGITGIAAQSRDDLLNMVRTIVIQLATHYGPDNVKIATIFHPQEEREWAWLRWLPHTWNNEFTFRYLADSKQSVHRLLLRLNDELNQRQNKRDAQGTQNVQNENTNFPFYYICIVASQQLTENEPVIQRLQTEGPELGFYPIFLNTEVKKLPQYCQAIIKIVSKQATLAFLEPTITRFPFIPDRCSPKLARRFSNIMAPLRLESTATLRLPDAVSLLEMLKVSNVDDISVYEQWQAKIKENGGVLKSIAAPIGWGMGNETLILDLHEKAHGPNGLIAGMVGAGKSILLQSLVASLAVHYHPDQVAFVLIDYKGGGMADPFKGLPHTLGVIDNLQKGNLAQRALNSFDTETIRRLEAFKKAGVNHIDQYHKIFYSQTTSEPDEKLPPIPYLVIIVDEFAEMKTERPEEAKGFIRIARLGRALGYRMILAMQKPEGIVDGQIEANTRFRLCLRVAQPSDSKAMLKRPDAAFLSHSGRAYFQVGVNEIFEQFQVAYGEQTYDPDGIMSDDPNEIFHVKLDGRRVSLLSPRDEGKKSISEENQKKQLSALVAHIEDEARSHNISRGAPLWLPILPQQILLLDLLPSKKRWNGKRWPITHQPLKPAVGKIDIPDEKTQPLLQLDFEAGNYLIFGASGSGKTTFLKTLIMSLTLNYSPADVNIYVLDFGGQGLGIFDPYPMGGIDREPSLPHIGDVVLPDEPERVIRLLNILRKEIKERSKLFSASNVDSLSSYRRKTKQQLPALVFIIDNYVKFAALFDDQQELLKDIIRGGISKGIYVIVVTNNVSDMHIKVRELFEQVMTFNLTKNDYSDALGERPTIPLEAISGRGLIKHKPPLEFQIALPEKGENDVERNSLLKERIQKMSEKWAGFKAKPIPVLEDIVSLRNLLDVSVDSMRGSHNKLWVPIGVNVTNLDVFILELRNKSLCLVAGTSGSGKTTLLTSLAVALGFRYEPNNLKLFVFDSGKQNLLQLNELPHIKLGGGYSYQTTTGTQSLMQNIAYILEQRQSDLNEWQQKRLKSTREPKPEFSPIIIIADDVFDSVYDGTSKEDKEYMIKIARVGHELNISLIISGSIMDVVGTYNNNLLNIMKRGQRIILGSNDEGNFSKLGINSRLSRTDRETPLTVGEGFWVGDGQYQKIKFAILGQDNTGLDNVIEEIKQKYPITPDEISEPIETDTSELAIENSSTEAQL